MSSCRILMSFVDFRENMFHKENVCPSPVGKGAKKYFTYYLLCPSQNKNTSHFCPHCHTWMHGFFQCTFNRISSVFKLEPGEQFLKIRTNFTKTRLYTFICGTTTSMVGSFHYYEITPSKLHYPHLLLLCKHSVLLLLWDLKWLLPKMIFSAGNDCIHAKKARLQLNLQINMDPRRLALRGFPRLLC